MKNLLPLILFFACPLYAGTLFLNSTPSSADVFILENKKPRLLGKTPLRISHEGRIVLMLSKQGYALQTNTYQLPETYLTEEIIFAPLSFTVNFPVDSGAVLVNGVQYTSLDGNLILPYGSYDTRYDKKKSLFIMEAKSPYTPYVAVFATAFILSVGMSIAGAAAEPIYRNRFATATDFDTAVNSITMATAMNNMMWTGVGIGTGSLIGMAVFSAYEARERKRIRRFSARNQDYTIASDLIEFNAIIDSPPSEALMTAFIRQYRKEGSRYLPQVYLKRAHFYAEAQQYREALRDLNVLINEYPAFDIYESANRLLGSIYMERKEYGEAYKAYKEMSLINYEEGTKKAIAALALDVRINPAQSTLLSKEAEQARIDKRFKDKTFLDTLAGY